MKTWITAVLAATLCGCVTPKVAVDVGAAASGKPEAAVTVSSGGISLRVTSAKLTADVSDRR